MELESLIEPAEKSTLKENSSKQVFEMQTVLIPPNRMTPLKTHWEKIC